MMLCEWNVTNRWPRATRIARRSCLRRNNRRESRHAPPSGGRCGPTHTRLRQRFHDRANDETQRRNDEATHALISPWPHHVNAGARHSETVASRTRAALSAVTIAPQIRCWQDLFCGGAFLRCVQTLAVCPMEREARAL